MMSRPLVLTMALVVPALPAAAGGGGTMSGEYRCASGCRLTDAPPSIEIEGLVAHCMNEFGGTFQGRVLTDHSIACFNKTGTLSADGKTLLWSDGVLWKRR